MHLSGGLVLKIVFPLSGDIILCRSCVVEVQASGFQSVANATFFVAAELLSRSVSS
jgi:hypothetical protein